MERAGITLKTKFASKIITVMTEEWDSMDNLTKMNNQNFKKVLEELWDGKGSIKLPGGNDLRKEAVSLLTQARNATAASYKNSIGKSVITALLGLKFTG